LLTKNVPMGARQRLLSEPIPKTSMDSLAHHARFLYILAVVHFELAFRYRGYIRALKDWKAGLLDDPAA
jgi:hypothetical protein